MEKPTTKPKLRFLSMLPKAAAALRFQNPDPFSPKRDKRAGANANKLKAHQNRGFSAPITSFVFEEARSKSRKFEAREPTSPKISCMGQIKHKKKISKKKINLSHQPKEVKPSSSSQPVFKSKPRIAKTTSLSPKKKSNSLNLFSSSRKPAGRKSDASAEESRLPDRAPSLSHMKRFASGRDTLSRFDWTTAQVAPEDSDDDHRRYYSDEGREDSDEEDEEIIIPFSAPILVSGVGSNVALEPRKEINLWKRRTMAQPKPLQLNTLVTSR